MIQKNKYFSRFLISLLVFIMVVHAWAVGVSAYFTIWWLDMGLHFLGGIWLGAIGFFLLYSFGGEVKLPKLVIISGIIGFAAFVGVLWEFFEFTLDMFVLPYLDAEKAQLGLNDTLSDLFFDMVGAFVSSVYLLMKK